MMKIKEVSERIVGLMPEGLKRNEVAQRLTLIVSILVSGVCIEADSVTAEEIETDLSGDRTNVEQSENVAEESRKQKASQIQAVMDEILSQINHSDYAKKVQGLLATDKNMMLYNLFFSRYEIIINDKKWIDLQYQYSNNEITIEELKGGMYSVASKEKEVYDQAKLYAEASDLFEEAVASDLGEVLSKFPSLRGEEELLTEALERGFEFRITESGGLNVYARTGLLILFYQESKEFDVLEKELLDAFSKYKEVPLAENIRVEVDQETEIDLQVVQSKKYKGRISIFLKTAKVLEVAKEKGFWLKIEQYNPTDDSFRLSVFQNDFKKGEIVGSDDRIFWQRQLLNIIGEASHDPTEDSEYIQKQRSLDEFLKENNFNSFPEGLELDERRVEVVNATIKALFENGLKINYATLRFFMDNLPPEVQISSVAKEDIILAIYEKMHEKGFSMRDGVPILTHIINNIENYFYLTKDLLSEKNLSEREFDELAMYHYNFLQRFISFLIQSAPEEALKNLDKLTNVFNKEIILAPKNFTPGEKFGMTVPRFSIMQIAFKSNPSLIPKYKHLYEGNPALEKYMETLLKNLGSYSAVRASSHDTNLTEFSSSDQAPGSLFITEHIPSGLIDQIVPETMSEREKTDLTLAIARNISYASGLDKQRALLKFLEGGDRLIKFESTKVLETGERIRGNPIFADKKVMHLSHFGQGVDAFGTEGVINAIKKQQERNSGTHQLFDAETQKGKTKAEKEKWLKDVIRGYIKSDKPVVLFLDGHANKDLFSVLLEYQKASAWDIALSGETMLGLFPEEIAKAVIKRQKYRDQHNITEPDLILFMACRGDYVTNLYTEIKNLLGGSFSEEIMPPAIMTAAESGENSQFDKRCEDGDTRCQLIPQYFLRETLMLGDGIEKTTYGTFLENQYNMTSNPTLYYPVLRDGKWVPQNIR